jgi:hypothetical protein
MSWELDVDEAMAGVRVRGETPDLRAVAIQEAAEAIRSFIVAQWPVDTGLSVAGFKVQQRGERWWVVNEVDYVEFVWEQAAYGGPPGLIYRIAEPAISAAEPVFRDALAAKVYRSQVVGARGSFKLDRNPAYTAFKARIKTRNAIEVLAPLTSSGALTTGESGALLGLLRAGRFADAVRRLAALGYTREAAAVDRVARGR